MVIKTGLNTLIRTDWYIVQNVVNNKILESERRGNWMDVWTKTVDTRMDDLKNILVSVVRDY